MKSSADDTRHKPRQITVVRPGALGDTLLTLPALAALRHWAPAAHITFIARAEVLPLALANGLADRAWPWELLDWGALFAAAPAPPLTDRAQMELSGADVVVMWAPDPEGAIAGRLADLGVRRALVAPALPPEDSPASLHAAAWLAASLRPLGVEQTPREALARLTPTLRPPAAEAPLIDALWREWRAPERVVALHPGSGSPVKRWPAGRFAEVALLARDAGYAPLLLAGEADEQALAETQAALARLGASALVARGLRVATLAALLARCAGYVGCDSGVSHLAGLVGVPTVAVFGPTDPARWAPLGPHVAVARAPDARLDHLDAAPVWAALRTLLANDAHA